MGTASSTSPHAMPTTSSDTEALKGFSLHQPTAAVVGAGIAGVHTAYELAQLGFDVTVFERNDRIASGETRYALPFVGVGLLEPWLAKSRISWDILQSLLFSSTCPTIIACDHPFNTMFSATLQRWLYCRSRSVFTDTEAMWYTDNLSRLSVSVIEDIVKKHPEMADHITSTDVNLTHVDPGAATPTTGELVLRKATTAHAKPIAIDPVGWTVALADLVRKKYGVRFALGERVDSAHTYLKYDVESTKSLTVSKPDAETPGQRVQSEALFDVVVYTAGAQTSALTWQSSQVPVLGLSGWAVMLRNPSGKLQSALQSLFGSAPGSAVALSPRCSFFGTTGRGALADEASAANGTHPDQPQQGTETWCRLSGLLSLDTTSKTAVNVRRVLKRMEAYLRVYAHSEVPLVALLDDPVTARTVQVQEYVRAFTPDGVPIIDHSGGAFNTYVCCGFGDQAPDFAPGASKILGKLVEQQAQILLEDDRKYMEEHGIPTAALPSSRRSVVETELEMLMNGVLPSTVGTKGSSYVSYMARFLQSIRGTSEPCSATTSTPPAPATPHAASTSEQVPSQDTSTSRPPADAVRHISFEKNPFSTDRYRGVIRKEVRDVTHRSPLSHFYDVEKNVSESIEPMLRRFRVHLVRSAREDNIPGIVRAGVMYFFYDAEDDADEKAQQDELTRRVQALSRKIETDGANAAGRGNRFEMSEEKQAELAQRAREAFLGGGQNTGKV